MLQQFKNPGRKALAFTLIELLIVIAIIGILAGLLLLPTKNIFSPQAQSSPATSTASIVNDLYYKKLTLWLNPQL